MLAALVTRRPVLVLNRGVSFPLGLNRFGYRSRGVDAIIAVCGSIKQRLVAQGVRADKIHVVYSGTDTERFHPKVDGTAVRVEAGIAPQEFLVTQIGVRSWKGNDDVMAAMTAVVRQAPQARLLIVGARRPDRLLASARACGLDPSVLRIWGYRTDIPEILAASDCCVDASWSGLGITGTLREALAVGTPVIATALEGNVELVSDRVTGLLVPPRDPDRIAESILALIADPALRHETAQAGRRLVEARFSLRAKLDAIEALYRRLVAERDGAARRA
jgi:glycosyltransferase involved in cell wall biosynthesis